MSDTTYYKCSHPAPKTAWCQVEPGDPPAYTLQWSTGDEQRGDMARAALSLLRHASDCTVTRVQRDETPFSEEDDE